MGNQPSNSIINDATTFKVVNSENEQKNLPIPKVLVYENINDSYASPFQSKTGQIAAFLNCKRSNLICPTNKRLESVIAINCEDCYLQIQDSNQVATKRLDLINCKNIKILIEVADIRFIRLWNCSDCIISIDDYPTLTENFTFSFLEGCKNMKIERCTLSNTDEAYSFGKPLQTVSIKIFDVPLPADVTRDDYYCARLDNGLELITWKEETKLTETSDILITTLTELKSQTIYEDPHEFDEIVDTPEDIHKGVVKIAQLIKNAKHTVVYTGAGISTAAQIPDFRGPNGAWTNREKGRQTNGIDITLARPTLAHYAITLLVNKGLVKMIISTNMDGLHRRSGVTSDNIVELHGNSYRELCDSCDKEYIRDFNVGETVKNRRDHKTGRFCECGGNLRDSIIHFCENMREKDMKIATENARKADLAIVMGTSMNVHPAASLCDKVLKKS